MADISEKSSKESLLAGALLFVAFETVAFYGLQFLTNRLPRRYRGQVMGWFYLAMLMSFVLLIPLFLTTD